MGPRETAERLRRYRGSDADIDTLRGTYVLEGKPLDGDRVTRLELGRVGIDDYIPKEQIRLGSKPEFEDRESYLGEDGFSGSVFPYPTKARGISRN